MTDKDLLTECLEAFEALTSTLPSLHARKLPHKPYNGTSAYQLAQKMAEAIRQHLAGEKA